MRVNGSAVWKAMTAVLLFGFVYYATTAPWHRGDYLLNFWGLSWGPTVLGLVVAAIITSRVARASSMIGWICAVIVVFGLILAFHKYVANGIMLVQGPERCFKFQSIWPVMCAISAVVILVEFSLKVNWRRLFGRGGGGLL